MELLLLGDIVTCCAIAGVNLNDTGAETIVTVCPSSKMLGQITNLTSLNTPFLTTKTSNTSSFFPSCHANRVLRKNKNLPTQKLGSTIHIVVIFARVIPLGLTGTYDINKGTNQIVIHINAQVLNDLEGRSKHTFPFLCLGSSHTCCRIGLCCNLQHHCLHHRSCRR